MAKVIVEPGSSAVVQVDGAVTAVLGPGRHRLPGPWWRRRVHPVDQRRRVLVVGGQEVSASDVPGIKVSATAHWGVADPVAWLQVSAEPVEELRLAVQLAVRDWAAGGTLEQLLADRTGSTAALTTSVVAAVEPLGVFVSQVSIRDLVVPVELRRALTAVQSARQEGLASLERARGETAALRAMANGARLLAEHPALLQLRTVQAAGAGAGTVVVELPRQE